MPNGPAQQQLQEARHHQRQHGGPEQRKVGVIIGTPGQHGHQLAIGAPFHARDGLSDLALLVFVEGSHAFGL
ncbi:hypothetical protein D3C73_1385630 [compost metagenome]